MAARIALSWGSCENFTYTRVPPRKSMPRGMPCQKSIDRIPATLKTSDKAMKYHFLPRKSMFALLKNSTLLKPFQNLDEVVIPNAPACGRERNPTSDCNLDCCGQVLRCHVRKDTCASYSRR